jgi:hypothetical protein
MRGKIDAKLERRRGKGKKPPPVPGGKALQRAFLFLDQRDPRLGDDLVASLPDAAAARPKFAQRKKALRAKGKGAANSAAAKRRGGASPAAKKYATALITLFNAATAATGKAPRAPSKRGAAKAGQSLSSASASWQGCGPSVIRNGQTYGSNRIDVIGRVSCIAVDPKNPAHLLVGSAAGGIWESQDAGATWAARTDLMPSLSIGAIAFDPVHTSIVYAGTGEGNSGAYSILGVGIYKSTDGGLHWSLMPGSTTFLGHGFFDLQVNPILPQQLYAGTTGGFYRSLDGGLTWTQKVWDTCWKLSLGMIGPQMEVLCTCSSGLFRSMNNGGAFTQVLSLPNDPQVIAGVGASWWTRLAVDRVKSTPMVAYAFGCFPGAWHGTNPPVQDPPTPYLWRRDNSGAWTQILPLPIAPADLGQAWYDWYVAATPNNTNEVYLGHINGSRGNFSGVSWSWTPIVTNGANSIHPDQHCLTFAPNNFSTIYAGNDGGIFRSTNKGATWTALNDGLGITDMEFLAGNPSTSEWLMAGTNDNGTNINFNISQGTAWDHVADGDGGDCGVDQTDPRVTYHSYQYVSLAKSLNSGILGSWSSVVATPNVATLFYPPVEVAGSTVVIGYSSLWYTLGPGLVGTYSLAPYLSANELPSAMRAGDSQWLILGTTLGNVFRISFVGGTPSVTKLAAPDTQETRYISCIAVDPSNPNRWWVTFSQRPQTGHLKMIYLSNDAGLTWIDRTNPGLPNPLIPFNAVVVDPGNYQRVFAGLDQQVYESTDLGVSWAIYGTDLPNAIVGDLLLHAQDRVLFAGTRARGVWKIPV